MSDFRIMSFDGGPGAFTAPRLLQAMEVYLPGTLASTTLFAGVSSGTAMALLYALRLSQAQGEPDVEAILKEAVEFVDQICWFFYPEEENWKRLLCGQEPMYSADALRDLCHSHFGDATLSDLTVPVVVVCTRMNAPWRPEIVAWIPGVPSADGDLKLTDLALRSGAFPIMLPIQGQRTDGGLFQNNPAMAAVAAVLAARQVLAIHLDDVVLLSFGADGGTSSLSNMQLPDDDGGDDAGESDGEGAPTTGQHVQTMVAPANPIIGKDTLPVPTIPSDIMDAATPEMQERLREGLENASRIAHVPQWMLDELQRVTADHPIGDYIDLDFFGDRTRVPLLVADDTEETDWGWSQWLVALVNPIYLFQTWINSQGQGSQQLVSSILLSRQLRVAPTCMLGTNQQFLMLLLRLEEYVLLNADLVTLLWSFPPTSDYFAFEPTIGQTLGWLEDNWSAEDVPDRFRVRREPRGGC
ncbi:MAG: hypothetical protein H6742_09115 [Alphaproteobacteria bacterium]|nr:hypothetical protein [Alphaproteobacteria bacterium]